MKDPQLLARIEAFAKPLYDQYTDEPGLWKNHVRLVRQFALKLAKAEGANPQVVEIAALLHDVGKFKGYEDHHIWSCELAKEFLQGVALRAETKALVLECITKHRTRFAAGDNPLEVQVLQAADALGTLFDDDWQEHSRASMSREALVRLYAKVLDKIRLDSAHKIAKAQIEKLEALIPQAPLGIERESLAGKIVLEVGSGRGETTHRLVDLLEGLPGAQFIATDISDHFFHPLGEAFQDRKIQIWFICTAAGALEGIENSSVDYIVCNYTLCAVNSQADYVALALRRFWEVLKEGGKLFIEEEFPVSQQDSSAQEIWADKWRILKSAMILTGKTPYNEIEPTTMAGLCKLVGFGEVEWAALTTNYRGAKVLDFFQKRLDALLPEFPNHNLQAGFSELAAELQLRAEQVGSMEIPYYQLTATKLPGG